MNVSPGKILLGLSVTAITYMTWDHLFSEKKNEAPPVKPPALTAAIVNHMEVLSLGRDVFESVAVDRSEDTAAANAIAAATGQAAAQAKALPPLALQGIFMTPTGHAALINGVPVNEGEEAELNDGGAKIFAKKVGDDFAIIECNGRSTTLKLADPPPTLSAPTAAAAPSAAPTPAYRPPTSATPTSSNPNPAGHGGGSDPYAGHRTGRH